LALRKGIFKKATFMFSSLAPQGKVVTAGHLLECSLGRDRESIANQYCHTQ
jgi:hypothetical protein